jgi:hypothetical protein
LCGYGYLNRERMCVCSVRVAAALRRGVDLVGLPVAVPAAHTVWVWCGFPSGSIAVGTDQCGVVTLLLDVAYQFVGGTTAPDDP